MSLATMGYPMAAGAGTAQSPQLAQPEVVAETTTAAGAAAASATPATTSLAFAAVVGADPTATFDFEDFVVQDLGVSLDRPPPNREVCQSFLRNACRLGKSCPYRHIEKPRAVVCKHWLRGLCKKGDRCEFLHEYNMKRMPECWFFAKLGECTNPECQYLHIDPSSRIKECAWYARGFCKHGPECRHRHVRRAPCPTYLSGFCPKGEDCSFGHPKYEVPIVVGVGEEGTAGAPRQIVYRAPPLGHTNTASNTHTHTHAAAPPQQQQPQSSHTSSHMSSHPPHVTRSTADVTCFKCGERGHYASSCPKRRRTDDDAPRSIQTIGY